MISSCQRKVSATSINTVVSSPHVVFVLSRLTVEKRKRDTIDATASPSAETMRGRDGGRPRTKELGDNVFLRIGSCVMVGSCALEWTLIDRLGLDVTSR